ncbi:PREDICTED: fatty acid amide hydrolase-like isoform X3 [Nelumbo nucifera]|uniref:Fatty acid amide hydrolase-like isoform X3 n=1 Tax=Nelumbo nucifera TaxID=4432 RepID=A0A1U7Z9Q2_NELNU|nr:PREDICTED: fatty acid amide hydrolase-like isoform X3 [Nelumbo nucifera]
MGWFFKTQRVIYKPVEEVDLSPDSDEVYLRANVKAPRMAGFLIKIAAWILESRILGAMLVYILKGENLIHKLVSFAELKEPPVYVPYHPWKDLKEQEAKCIPSELPPSEKAQHAVDCLPLCSDVIINTQQPTFRRWTIQDYSRAYISGETTPLVVAKSFLDALHASSTPPLKMSFFISYNAEDILRQATESTLRYERGEPISVLDGVPIAVKDEIDSKPYQTTGGTKWLHKLRHCTDDACCVKHLRSCGAIIVGKTNMHELGVGTSGINPHYGATRNPYDPSKVTGGSSSGSAAVVSAGLCPVALGVDGGGSVRIPASLCGVIGFKPTFGRVSHSGVLPLNWTVGMVGILAGTVEDALIVYAAISGHHPSNQPTILPTVDVTLPEIEVMRLAHYLTIGSECNASIRPHLEKMDVAELGCDARVALRIYGAFNSREYLNAQRIRNRQMHFYKHILERADFIVIPTTGVTAYPIMEDALKYGDFDYINGAALVRYQIAGNFLGLPAVTVPVGYDKSGMPIGLQFIGRPWSESTLLHIAFAVQVLSIQSYRKPKVFYNLLSKKEEP